MAGRSEPVADGTRTMGGLGGAISLTELFPDPWVQSHTDARNIEEFIFESDFDVDSSASLEELPDYEWDRYVQSHAEFGSWSEMVSTAVEHYLVEATERVDAADD